MDRKKASDFPQELLNLFDVYVHGGMSRRAFLDGAQKFAVGGASAGALLEMLKPNYAWAIQVPPDDSRVVAMRVDVPSPNGNGSIKGYMVRPAGTEKLPVVLVVHENRGLNPYIEDVARRLAIANFVAFAPDGLTSVGGYPGDDAKGAALFKQVDGTKMQADFAAVAEWLKSLPDSTGKLGAIGFCRRRRRQQARREHGLRPRRCGSVLRPTTERRRRDQNQGADQRAICGARHAHYERLARVRCGAQRGRPHPRGAYLQGRQPRLPQ
jgi:Dienelactone hydrolase family